MIRHQNLHGECPKCEEIFDRYPGFHPGLRLWFAAVRRGIFDAHISCAGRGKIDQMAAFWKRTSRAVWGKSSHNYNAAIDLFQMTADGHYSLNPVWFAEIFDVCPLPPEFLWYGNPDHKSDFFELPHIEVYEWYDQVPTGVLKLVEP